jgi:hypothetical protein
LCFGGINSHCVNCFLFTQGSDARRFYGDANQVGKLSGIRSPFAGVAQRLYCLRPLCFEEVDEADNPGCGSMQSYNFWSIRFVSGSKSISSANRQPEICLDVLVVEHLLDGCGAYYISMVASSIAKSW